MTRSKTEPDALTQKEVNVLIAKAIRMAQTELQTRHRDEYLMLIGFYRDHVGMPRTRGTRAKTDRPLAPDWNGE